MAYNRQQARRVCTPAEFALFEASLADRIREHTPAQLRTRIARARVLRDKYRDLHRRQRRATKEQADTGRGARSADKEQLQRKAMLFDEALGRFTRRAEQLDRQARARAAAEVRAKAKAVAAKKASARAQRRAAQPGRKRSTASGASGKGASDSGFVSAGAAAADRRQRAQKTRSDALRGHQRAAGKRAQARRDQRG